VSCIGRSISPSPTRSAPRSEGRLDKSEPLRMRAIEAGWQLDAWHVAMHLAAPGLHDLLSLTDTVVAAFQEAGLDVVVVERGDGWTETFGPTAAALLAPLLEARGDLLRTLTTYLDSSRVGHTGR
jgi:hypothetical protein